MRKMIKDVYTKGLFRRLTFIYTIILLTVCGITMGIAYNKEFKSMISQQELALHDLEYAYEVCVEDFWRVYMPVFENRSSIYAVLKDYLTTEEDVQLSQFELIELMNAMKNIMASDQNMEWIGCYSGVSERAYLYYRGDTSLTLMPKDFSFAEMLVHKKAGMEISNSKYIEKDGNGFWSFAICGDTSKDMLGGKILIGYRAENLISSYIRAMEEQGIQFVLQNETGIIYHSGEEYGEYSSEYAKQLVKNSENEWGYCHQLNTESTKYQIFGIIPVYKLIFFNSYALQIILIVLMLFVISVLLLSRSMRKSIIHKIENIMYALERIGKNDLDYRISVPENPSDEFEEISQSINKVTEQLKENLDREYLERMKRKEAELSELQAKFNPHFLYNSLEVIRGKVYDNGDAETANVLVKLSQIFRRLIGGERFISIREEMDFCNLFLSFLEYRYDNQVEIIYDIDSEVLSYGIIRNLLQPILENYFVHGYSSERKNNKIWISGKIQKERFICFQVKDNGLGISPDRLKEIDDKLNSEETISSEKTSFGIISVQRKIRLFYGTECGVKISRNKESGVTVEFRILMLSCDEHKERMGWENMDL